MFYFELILNKYDLRYYCKKCIISSLKINITTQSHIIAILMLIFCYLHKHVEHRISSHVKHAY